MARVLIIDDEPDVRAVMQDMLELAGHEVLAVANGQEGIDAFRARPADVVITDLFMPDKEGLETIQDLGREFPGVKIIAMSGGGRSVEASPYLSAAKGLGAVEVMTKPFGAEALDATLARVLRASPG